MNTYIAGGILVLLYAFVAGGVAIHIARLVRDNLQETEPWWKSDLRK